jgi:hypothetical protein
MLDVSPLKMQSTGPGLSDTGSHPLEPAFRP